MSRGTFIVRLIAIAALLLLAVWLYSLLSSTHSSSEVATTDQIDEPLSATFAVPLEAAQPSHKLPEKRIVPDEMPQEPLTEKIISGSLTISGNVLNAVGDSLPNIEIIATPPRRFANAAVQNVIETTSRSDSSGHYHLDGLKPGDYQIRTVETGLYPSATISARAGT